MRRNAWHLAGLVAFFLGDVAHGASPADLERLFLTLDKNEDDYITRDEMIGESRRLFDKLISVGDLDQDGKLTLEEFEAGMKVKDLSPAHPPKSATRPTTAPSPKKPGTPLAAKSAEDGKESQESDRVRQASHEGHAPTKSDEQSAEHVDSNFIQLLDANQDHRLSKAELNRLMSKFKELDLNGDGVLDAHELTAPPPPKPVAAPAPTTTSAAVAGASSQGTEGRGFSGHGGGHGGGRGGGRGRKPSLEEMFSGADVNKDGFLTPDEVYSPLKEQFATVDLNHDGKLSLDELKQVIHSSGGGGMGGGGGRGLH